MLILLFKLKPVGASHNKKPTTVASRGFLSKSVLASTSPGHAAYYDDYQDLLNIFNHYATHPTQPAPDRQPPIFHHKPH
ncbi:MAG TPA: hypothetical protein VH413_06110 [Verrucomicrobiae bacterium]|nr:hypothetical protein [Verrucomicrobiae bacterium]